MPAEGELFAISFSVPGAPRGKGRPRGVLMGGHVRFLTDAKTRSEEGAVRFLAAAAMGGKIPYEGAVILRVCAYRAIPAAFSLIKRGAAEAGHLVPTTKPDADNYLKLAGDALNGIIIRDDSQVVTAVIHKRFGESPRLTIDVRSIAS